MAVPPRLQGGGYDCEFVERPPASLQTECTICLLVLREPYITDCCGHNFCRTCIATVRNAGKACPLCNEARFATFPNKGLERSLKELEVQCGNKGLGCNWNGEFRNLNNHIAMACPYVEVKCRYANCHSVVTRKDATVHEAGCRFRPYRCNWCQQCDSWYDDVSINHWPVCPKFPVICNQCGAQVERQQFPSHVDYAHTLVDCEFSSAGCKTRLPRKDLQDHLFTEQLAHVMLLNRRLADENMTLTRRLTDLEVKMASEIGELKTKISDLMKNKQQQEFLRQPCVATPDLQQLRHVEELTRMFGSSHVTSDEILDYIDNTCAPKEDCSSPNFIRNLTTAIVQATVTNKGSDACYSEELFQKRLFVLTGYANGNDRLGLEVLMALQEAVTKLDHPPKLLYRMFNALYDCEVVTESAFYTWRDQAAQGTEGKGAAIMSVKPFFDWLDSAEKESDPEDTSHTTRST